MRQGSGFKRTRELSVRFATSLPSSVVTVVPATFVDATTISAARRRHARGCVMRFALCVVQTGCKGHFATQNVFPECISRPLSEDRSEPDASLCTITQPKAPFSVVQ